MKRFYNLSLLTVGVFLAGQAYAQQDTVSTFTLDQCLEYALQHSINNQNATLDQQIANARVKETIGIGLPQISGSASVVHNPKLPRFFSAYQDTAITHQAGGFQFLNSEQAKQLGVNHMDVIALRNFFQLASSGTATITANQLIFNGSYLVGLKASKTYKELATRGANVTKKTTIVQVTKAYFAV